MSPVKYELGFYIPEDAILHSYRLETLKSYTEIECFIRENDTSGRDISMFHYFNNMFYC
jgi:hypothetical protein